MQKYMHTILMSSMTFFYLNTLKIFCLLCWAWASDYSDFSGCGAQALGQASAVAAPELQSTNSIVVAYGLSCSTACGIFLDQGSNWYLSHWQADSLPLSHQGSRCILFFDVIVFNMLNYMYVCVYKEYWPLVSFLVYKCSRLLRKVPVDSTCIFLSSLDGVFVDAEY